MKALVVGAGGLLGTGLAPVLTQKGYEVITVSRASKGVDINTDMSDPLACARVVESVAPDVIVNLAAITDVDLCESNIELAFKVHVQLSENLARCANGAHIVHVSTDHFYDMCLSRECDVVIRNNYAMTKYCAEKAFDESCTILRTNFFGKDTLGRGFCEGILRLVNSGEVLNLFHDVYFSPVSIALLCDVISACLQERVAGVFNVGSIDGMSKADFILEFLRLMGRDNFPYRKISVDDFGLKTTRPKDMRMCVEKIERRCGIKMPSLREEIERVSYEYK